MNADKNTITMYLNNPPYTSLSVTNPERFAGGRDWETDDEYRKRLLEVNRQDSFGSISYYEALGIKIEGVHDVKLVDSTSDKYTKTVLVNGDDKPTPDDIMIRALNEFTNQDNIVVGHKFAVTKPVYKTVNLQVRLYVSSNITDSTVKSCLNYLFDGGAETYQYTGLNIGDDMTKLQIITALESIDGVEQVSEVMRVTEKGAVSFNTLNALENEVLKVGEVTIIQEES